mgnify:CR=1 FL=1
MKIQYLDDDKEYNIKSFDELNNNNVIKINCDNINLNSLPEHLNLPLLQDFDCSYNNLSSLPKHMNLPLLQEFYCNDNNLSSLPEHLNLPLLQTLSCHHNNLSSLPLSLINCRNLRKIKYEDNPIDNLPLQLTRFINRLRQANINRLNIYNDTQNVHNSNIQLSIKESIEKISLRTDIPKYNKDELNDYIINDEILNCKEQLIEYINDESIHSLLLLTFSEVLWFVIQTIDYDFSDNETKNEIKRILNEDMNDSLCKCFTGRISRVINCLSGFSDLVKIEIKDESQIGNVIVLIKNQLSEQDDYTVEKHKELVKRELIERGYETEIINKWLEYIE